MSLDERDAAREELFSTVAPRLRLRVSRRSTRSQQKRATCSVMSHWGEIIQGPVLVDGRAQIGLVTLPDPAHYVTASATPAGQGVSCDQPWKEKSIQAAQLVLDRCVPGRGVDLQFHSTIPEGVGAGSSTADCTATVYAIRELFGVPHVSELDILADVFAAEGPCDPLILLDADSTLLWGSRAGRLLKKYDIPLPAFYAIGFVTDPVHTVSTVQLADEQAQNPPTSREIDAFSTILREFERALSSHSARGVGQAATASGSLNQSRCRIAGWDGLTRLSEDLGALGVSCAHSGTAAAFLFDPSIDDLDDRLDEATAELQARGAAFIHRFRTDLMPPFWSASHEMTLEP